MNSVQQQREHHHWKVLVESFHLSGHTFRFRWTVQDLEVFFGLVETFGSEKVYLISVIMCQLASVTSRFNSKGFHLS